MSYEGRLSAIRNLTVIGIVRYLRACRFTKNEAKEMLARCRIPELADRLAFAIDLL